MPAALAALLVFVPAQGGGPFEQQYQGTLGGSRVGLTVVYQGTAIASAHYFYQRYLADIPLTGSVENSRITLQETAGVFHLHFVGNGSEGGRPLDFENSVGMEGEWTSADGRQSYPVKIGGVAGRAYAPGERYYAAVTNESDAAFESRVQSLYRAVLGGDKPAAVRFISYPLTVNPANGVHKVYRSGAEVLAAWNQIFTPQLIALLREDLPHEMFVHEGMAMLGNGEVWFDNKGLAVVNTPSPLP